MTIDSADTTPHWRTLLPTLTARQVTLREATASDLRPLVDLLSIGDASRFGIDEPVSEVGVQQLVERSVRERAAGTGFIYVVTIGATRGVIGLAQVRQLDLGFESAEWECTLAPSWRGTGVFLELARLCAPPRGARTAAERTRQRCAPQAGRGAGRDPAPVGPARR
jgi:RimJ/RimL family protein N-acetyltransferase